jgi:hypothetical protein
MLVAVAAAVSLRGGCHEIEGKRGGGRGVRAGAKR